MKPGDPVEHQDRQPLPSSICLLALTAQRGGQGEALAA